MRRIVLTFAVCGVLLLSGCLSPITLNRAVVAYDDAVTDSIAKQLLINIARAQHHQPVHFTGVSNIAATFDFRVSAGATPALTGEASRALMPIFGGSVAENPTISIVPIDGEEFTKRLLTPFQETKFLLLLRQRYDIDLLLRLMAQELRIMENGQDRLLPQYACRAARLRDVPSGGSASLSDSGSEPALCRTTHRANKPGRFLPTRSQLKDFRPYKKSML